VKIELTVTDEECREIIAAWLEKKLGFYIPPKELSVVSYGGYTVGKYGGYEHPPKELPPIPKAKPIDVNDVGPAPVVHDDFAELALFPVSTVEVITEAKDPPF